MLNRQNQVFFLAIAIVLVFGFFGLVDTVGASKEAPSLQEIQAAIAAKGANWTAGKTSVADVPIEKLFGSVLHPDALDTPAPLSLLEDAYPSGAPAALDWRDYGGHDWTTPITSQGGCGSCYIFGTFAASEAAMKVQAGTYGYLAEPDLSEQFALSCNAAFNCTSGYSGDALDYLKGTGSTDEDCFPYTASDATPCSNRCSNWDDRLHWIDDWDHPGGYPNWWPSVAQIKTAIETYGPVSTYMRVYYDFKYYYTGGVYEYVSGSYLGAHTVTLVGWDDSLQCWIAKNSWGTGWGENGWFRIKWGEVEIERQTEFIEAGMSNLTDHPHTGWTYSLVPRNSTGTTWGSCSLPATLNGNSNTTYLNFAGINNGSETAPPFGSRFYLDDVYVAWANWGKILAGQGFFTADLGAITARGGRHTLGINLDINDQVWESNETDSDNKEYRQFIWSPYALSNNTPVTRTTPPKKDSYGHVWYNSDGFSFLAQENHPDDWWSAVGILPSSSGADYDLMLHDIGTYTGSEGGFGNYLVNSSYGGSVSEFVIVNDNMASAGTYYAGAINYNAGTGDFRIEEDTSTTLSEGTNGPYSKVDRNVLDIYECYLSAGDYGFKLDQTSGTCDLGMSLYDDETVTARKIGYMAGGYANSTGDGEDEYLEVTIPDSGYHGLVVWKVDSSDYAKAHSYRIKMGKCATPSTPANPSPVDGATNVSVDTDLNWSDSTNTEYYEVWLNEAGSGWVHVGDTETSAWALPTLNEATHYDWFIAANNICGTRIYVYWDFTTEDNTAPTPNPMTWATVPYELNTSQIRMVATTASDPTTPINYYFDFTSSPTGGAGGSDFGWTASTIYTDSGLGTNHQYGYRVRARDGSLNMTGYSGTSYDYTDIETPTGITFSTITSSSIQARSTNTPSGLTRGSSGLYIRNDTFGTVSGWKQNNSYWTSSGLSPNTQYSFRAIARNGDANETAWSPSTSRYTLANLPGAAAFTNITQTSIRANWTANGNPAGTQYYCQNTTAGTNSGWTTSTSWNSTGLSPGTTYAFRVKAKNGDGVETGWRSLGSQSTLPGADFCECDLDHSGACNILDWPYFIQDWGRTNCGTPPGSGDPPNDCECDMNVDGSCNILDWPYFIEDWGRTDCPMP